jgi:glycosyltransferase involved in cell wall biosynthesis
MPLVSIITPTKDRQNLLPLLWEYVRNQSIKDFEWLIHDGSQQPATFDWINNAHVTYTHAPEPLMIGAKRNALCGTARGNIIAHFDDDDFYGPKYLEGMLSFMDANKLDFVKLFGFFLYQRTHNVFAYWDLERDFPLHYRLAPNMPPRPQVNNGGISGKWGYGFSYVFHRRVWEEVHFPNQNHGEDQIFVDAVDARFKAGGKQDADRSCIHVIHTTNSSITYPQQILPPETLQLLFPQFLS